MTSCESSTLFTNKAIGSTIITSGEDTDTFKENVTDRYLYSAWQDSVDANPFIEFDLGSAQTIDAIGMFGLEGDSTDDHGFEIFAGAATDPAASILTGTLFANETFFESISGVSHRFWRFVFDGPAKMVNIMIGEKLIFERPMETDFMRPPGADDYQYTELYSEDGFPLGKLIEQSGKHLIISQLDMSHDFFHASWLPFIDYAYGDLDDDNDGVFYISWNEVDFPREAVFCVSDRTPGKQSYTTRDGTDGTLKILAYGNPGDAPILAPAFNNMVWDDGNNMVWDDGNNMIWEN